MTTMKTTTKPLTNFEYLRQRLQLGAGLKPDNPPPFQGRKMQEMILHQAKDQFTLFMHYRMVMGEMRYGKSTPKRVPFWHAGKAGECMCEYARTGNLECLIDAANYIRLEWRHSRHPRKHFNPVDRI